LVANRFIEDNWRLGSPETQGEIDFEAATTVEEKLEVAARIQATGPEELAPVLRRALLHPDENLRSQAVLMALGLTTTPEAATDILTAAANDQSENVRAYAMEVIREQQPEAQLDMFATTIHSPEKGVTTATVMELGRLHSKPAFSILIEGFKSGDPELAARINAEIRLVTDNQFSNYQEATAWWEANAEKFDDQLLQVTE
jgi:HEAT repeat protein